MPTPKKAAGWVAIAVACVGSFEGLRTAAYLDPVGIPTVCFGETKGVKMGDSYTAAECRDLLAERLLYFDRVVTGCVPAIVSQPPERRAAHVSLAYNIGLNAYCGSTVARLARAGDWVGSCNAFTMWTKATKVGVTITLPGLVRRRNEERALCLG